MTFHKFIKYSHVLFLVLFTSSVYALECDVNQFQYWSLMTIRVLDIHGQSIGQTNDELIAFSDDQCRGIASPVSTPEGNLFFLQFWSDLNQETMNVKYYHADTDHYLSIHETIQFQSGVMTGSISNPIVLNIVDTTRYGCMDPTAANYDPLADVDDGSCNHKPVIVPIPAQTILEDTLLTVQLEGSDIDLDSISFTAESLNPNVQVWVKNSLLTAIPIQNWFGQASIKAIVTDGLYTDNYVFTLTVQPVNDPPIISQVSNQQIYENQSTPIISFQVNDLENNQIGISVKSSNTDLVPDNNIVIGGSGNTWTLLITPSINRFGQSIITITASDAFDRTEQTFLIDVLPIDTVPAISSIDNQDIQENAMAGPLAFTVSDIGMTADKLTVSASSSDTSIIPNEQLVLEGTSQNRTLTITPNQNMSGLVYISLSVSNGRRIATTRFQIIIHPIADVPPMNRFLKLDSNGDPLPITATQWTMVKDYATQLIWEIKTDTDVVHHTQNRYTWYDDRADINGGVPGSSNNGVNTQGFISRLNTNSFGGVKDWRLPSIHDLLSIIQFNESPTVYTDFFPKNAADCYWTNTTHAESTADAWIIDFKTFQDNYVSKSSLCAIRAVRGGINCELYGFTDNQDGTITDNCTGLMWQSVPSDTRMTHTDAVSYCNNLSIANFSDWHIPTREELRTLVDYKKFSPATYQDSFPLTKSYHYWTYNTYASLLTRAWTIHFYYGTDYIIDKTQTAYVRAVRGGQSWDPDAIVIGSPERHSKWQVGNLMPITWSASSNILALNIYVSRQAGKSGSFELIAANTPNDGHFEWSITNPPSSMCMLKIEPVQFPENTNTMGMFELLPQDNPILLVQPNTMSIPAMNGINVLTVSNIGTGMMPWEVNSQASWIQIVQGATGSNDGFVFFSFQANPEDQRDGMIVISTTGSSPESQYITITQQTNHLIHQFTLFKQTDLDMPHEQTQGCNWIDVNQDYQDDLFIVNAFGDPMLFQNLGAGMFQSITMLEPQLARNSAKGASWGDMDNNGFPDVLIAYENDHNRLVLTMPQSFQEIQTSTLSTISSISTACAWADYNNDGWLDILITQLSPNQNQLYMNNGMTDFILTDVLNGTGQSCVWGDYTNDLFVDVMIANSVDLFRNTRYGTFESILKSYLNVDDAILDVQGASWGDFDNDGDLDCFIARMNNTDILLRNNGNGRFSQMTDSQVCLQNEYSSGSAWGDIDNDGDLDLFVTRPSQSNCLFSNNGDTTFTQIISGEIVSHAGNTCAMADYDNDGDLDIFVTNAEGANQFYQNNLETSNWLGVRCKATQSNRSAIGTRVKIKTVIAGIELWQMRDISSQTGRNSQNSLAIHFGLGQANLVDTLIIEWPSGIVQTFNQLMPNQYLIIPEQKDPVPLLSIAPAFHSGTAIGGTARFLIQNIGTGNLNWQADSNASWLQITKQSNNTNDGYIDVYYAKNPSDKRIGTIEISSEYANNSPIHIDIRQQANTPPQLSSFDNIVLSEDSSGYAIPFTVTDAESLPNDLQLLVQTTNETLLSKDQITIQGTGAARFMTLYPKENQFGQVEIIVTLTDGFALNRQTFIVTVQSVDDPPVMSYIPKQSTKEDTPFVPIECFISDVDTPKISVSIASSNQTLLPDSLINLIPNSSSWIIEMTPAHNETGTGTVTITAQDGTYTITKSFDIEVKPVDDPPVINVISDIRINSETSIPFVVSDLDTLSHDLNVSALLNNETLLSNHDLMITHTENNYTVTIYPPINRSGKTDMIITASDHAQSVTASVQIYLGSYSETVYIQDLPDLITNEDTPIYLSVAMGGPDDTALRVFAQSSNPTLFHEDHIQLDQNYATCTLWLTPTTNQSGSGFITLTVQSEHMDQNQAFSQDQTVFKVTVLPINDAPVITPMSDMIVIEDQALDIIRFSVSDIDQDNLVITVDVSNPTLIYQEQIRLEGFDNQWRLNLPIHENANGTSQITVTVSDNTLQSFETFLVTVLPVNDAPTMSSIENQMSPEDMPLGPLFFWVNDLETPVDKLNVTVVASNTQLVKNGISISGTGGQRQLMIQPEPNVFGETKITIRVTDQDKFPITVSQSFQWIVNPVNDVPHISSIQDYVIVENTTLDVQFSINDSETEVSRLFTMLSSSNTILIPDANLSIQGDSNPFTLHIVPASDNRGTARITILVSDGDISVSESFQVTVVQTNHPPVFAIGPDDIVTEDSGPRMIPKWAQVISKGAWNETEQTVQFHIIQNSNPDLFSQGPYISPEGSLSYTPAKDIFGEADIHIVLSDNGGGQDTSDSQHMRITVVPVNDPPSFKNGPDITVIEDSGIIRIFEWATEISKGPDNESDQTISFHITTYNPTLFSKQPDITSNGMLWFSTSQDKFGSSLIVVSIEDNGGGDYVSDSQSFTITIQPVNDAPVINPIEDITMDEDSIAGPIKIEFSDVETPKDELSLSVASSNTHLVPNYAIHVLPDYSMMISPFLDQSGETMITVTVSDGTIYSQETFMIHVIQNNDPPVISVIPSLETYEDTPLDPVHFIIQDVDTPPDALSITIISLNPSLIPNASDFLRVETIENDHMLLIQPKKNAFGTGTLLLGVSDSTDLSTSTWQAISITVQPVNDLPFISFIPDQVMNEDETHVIAFTVNDIETQALSLTVQFFSETPLLIPNQNDNAHLTADGAERWLEITPLKNVSGQANIIVTVIDSDAQTQMHFTVTIQPVNDPPESKPVTIRMLEDNLTKIQLRASDPDGDTITYQILSTPTLGKLTEFNTTTGIVKYISFPNVSGSDQFTYQASDGQFVSDIQTVSIIIEPDNDAPIALPISVTTAEDEPIQFLLHADDIDSSELVYRVIQPPTKGVVQITDPKTGMCQYKPNKNQNGDDFFLYTASDGKLDAISVGVSIYITPVNDAPIVYDTRYDLYEDTVLIADLLIEDCDSIDLQFELLAHQGQGQIAVDSDMKLTYTPTQNQWGQDSFYYRVHDAYSSSNTAMVVLMITPVNDVPDAFDGFYETQEDRPLIANLQGYDPDLENLVYHIETPPNHGVVSLLSTGFMTYTPHLNYHGADQFTFYITDAISQSKPATIQITIMPVNDAPIIYSRDFETREDTPRMFTLNFEDPEGSAVQFRIIQNPKKGECIWMDHQMGIFSYAPYLNMNGMDQFILSADDGIITSDPISIQINITPVNDKPIALATGISLYEDTSSTGTLLINEPDGDSLFYMLNTLPKKGQVTLTDTATGMFIYTPTENQFGTDTFTFHGFDGVYESDIAMVTIMITPVNDAPIVSDLSVETLEDTVVQFKLPATDVDENMIVFGLIDLPQKGIVNLTNRLTGDCVYLPNLDINGSDSFTFQVRDSTGEMSSIGNVTIHIAAQNDQPQGIQDTLLLNEDVPITSQLLYSDVDFDECTFSIIDNGLKGEVVLIDSKTGTYQYIPKANIYGMDSFSYIVSDGQLESDKVVILVEIIAINDAPVAKTSRIVTYEEVPKNGVVEATDIDSQALTFSIVKQGQKGQVFFEDATLGTYIYTPYTNETGDDVFMFSAYDGRLTSEPGLVTVTIYPSNDAPIANNLTLRVYANRQYNGQLDAYDPDEGDRLVYTIVNQTQKGYVLLKDVETGNFIYIPDQDMLGTDVFSYKVTDGRLMSNVASVYIQIEAIHDQTEDDQFDLNGNTVIDLPDVMIALQLLSGVSYTINPIETNRITLSDVLILLQKLQDIE